MDNYDENLNAFLFLFTPLIALFVLAIICAYSKEIIKFMIRISENGRKSRKSNRNTFKD